MVNVFEMRNLFLENIGAEPWYLEENKENEAVKMTETAKRIQKNPVEVIRGMKYFRKEDFIIPEPVDEKYAKVFVDNSTELRRYLIGYSIHKPANYIEKIPSRGMWIIKIVGYRYPREDDDLTLFPFYGISISEYPSGIGYHYEPHYKCHAGGYRYQPSWVSHWGIPIFR